MNRAERIYRLHALLQEKPRSLAKLQEELEASRATVVRDLGYMKDFMGAPIDYDRATKVPESFVHELGSAGARYEYRADDEIGLSDFFSDGGSVGHDRRNVTAHDVVEVT